MEIKIIEKNKKDFLDLLLLADEQENMIDKYIDRGTLFALYDNDLKSICVVTKENNTCEIKNLATYEKYQGLGYAKKLIEYVCEYYKKYCNTVYVGTGGSNVCFYEKCGFLVSHKIENFFVDNYDKPIIENGVIIVDMIYLKRKL